MTAIQKEKLSRAAGLIAGVLDELARERDSSSSDDTDDLDQVVDELETLLNNLEDID
jgi:Mg2+ and Co2+ transporter CorA